ncbi:MAG: hypothetical protein WCS34_02110 [Bacteroidales bacterium]
MKKNILLFFLLSIVGIGNIYAQKKTSQNSEIYQFSEPGYLLDGYMFNYTYQNGKSLHMEFNNGKARYRWLNGPRKGKGNQDITYRCRKIGNDLYLLNWNETGLKDYLTLVLNFKDSTVFSSIIVGYENNPNRPRRTTFEAGKINYLKIQK